MTTVMPARPRRADRAGGSTAGHRTAMAVLARTEAVRLLRHPATLAAVALLVGPWIYEALRANPADRYPVLQEVDRLTQLGTLFLLGGAALIAANLTVLRPHRHGTAGLYDVLVLPPRWRTGAFLLAVAPLGLLAALLVAARIGYQAVLAGAVGRPDPYELATGPAGVLLLGAVGVLLARLVRSFVLAPLALLALGAVTVLTAVPSGPLAAKLTWLLPVVIVESFEPPLPLGLSTRPAGHHLLYLAGLVAVVALAALVRTAGRRGALLPGLAAALALTAAAGTAQLLPPEKSVSTARVAATERPGAQQPCQRLDRVTYCAFQEYRPWVREWHIVVREILRRVPESVAREPLAVRQRVNAYEVKPAPSVVVAAPPVEAWRADDAAAGTPNAVTAGTRWGDGRSVITLAALVAHELVGRRGPGINAALCGARAVLVGWLAGQATAGTEAGLREVDATSTGGVHFTEAEFNAGAAIGDRELSMVLALLDRSDEQVAGVVLRHWAELSDADTATERAGELLGVPAPPAPPASEARVCT